MTETLLALVPSYGIWLVALSVMLSCLALPIPSSILVMAAGGFAAAGDLVYWQLIVAASMGFVVGDQVAYSMARSIGQPLVERMKRRTASAGLIDAASTMLDRYGVAAVFLSRTLFSPVGAYIGYLCGALKLDWAQFTVTAISGAICWSVAYSSLGYFFADKIAGIASLIGNMIGFILAGASIVLLIWWLRHNWRISLRLSGLAKVRELM